jgi:outer membrane receptor protein involved in Fe transport
VAGYALQAITHIGGRQSIAFGGDVYDEFIDSTRLERRAEARHVRALYPDGSRYRTAGLFAQDSIELLPGRLRAMVGGRLTAVRFRTFAERNAGLGVADSALSFRDLTFHSSVAWHATSAVTIFGVVSRGFRAPNLNDLGALGLNDLGYEIPAAAAAGALVGDSAGEAAVSSGRPVEPLRPERLFNYEAGMKFQTRRAYARVQVFDAEMFDPIVRRTLLFPAGGAPEALAGLAVTPLAPSAAQQERGLVTVATAFDRRAVKAFVNDGQARYYGLEATARVRLSPRWELEADYAFLAGRELNPDRPARRLSPQQGYAAARYTPSGRRPWMEWGVGFAGAQERLNGGDLDDERIGAARSRRDIADFFGGAVAAAYIGADGVFRPTGETLAEIQNRVLPLGAVVNGVRVAGDQTRVPLLLRTAGWYSLELRGGLPLGERVSLQFAAVNLLDRNYRLHGSGVDAPGFNAYLGIRYRF